MWWTLNLEPYPTRVCIFVCKALYNNQLTGSIPNIMGYMTSFQLSKGGLSLKLEGLSHKACLDTLGWRFMDALKPDFCNRDSKHNGGWRKQRSKIHDWFVIKMLLLCPMFGSSRFLFENQLSGTIPSSIKNIGTLEILWVHSIQWIWSSVVFVTYQQIIVRHSQKHWKLDMPIFCDLFIQINYLCCLCRDVHNNSFSGPIPELNGNYSYMWRFRSRTQFTLF